MSKNLVSNIKVTTRLRVGMLAGLAGGAAEVLWILLYSRLTGGSAIDVATGITSTFLPSIAAQPVAILIGLAIHFFLAAALGLAVTSLIRREASQFAGRATEISLIIAILAAVWVVNFLVILPIVNPLFVYIVPLPVSLVSKLLFGVAAAFALRSTAMTDPDFQTPHKES